MRLTFPGLESLTLAVQVGLIPRAWWTVPVSRTWLENGRLRLSWTDETVRAADWTTADRKSLAQLGISVDSQRSDVSDATSGRGSAKARRSRTDPADDVTVTPHPVPPSQPSPTEAFAHLGEAIPLQRHILAEAAWHQTAVLWVADSDACLTPVFQDLVRLGVARPQIVLGSGPDGGPFGRPNSRQDATANDGPADRASVALLRVVAPPVYPVLATLDGVYDGVRLFWEPAPRCFVPWGWSHPLASILEIPVGQWWALLDAGWIAWPVDRLRRLEDVAVLTGLTPQRTYTTRSEPFRVPVSVRLVPGGSDRPPTLWVIRDDIVERLEAFLREVQSDQVEDLSLTIGFPDRPENDADGTDDQAGDYPAPIAVLRIRPGRRTPPALALQAEEMTLVPGTRGLFVPVGRRLEPNLPPAMLTTQFTLDAKRLVWLTASDESGSDGPSNSERSARPLRVESIPESAFGPLASFVDYVLSSARHDLTAWVDTLPFDWSGYTVASPPAETPPPPSDATARRSRRVASNEAPPSPPRPTEADSSPLEASDPAPHSGEPPLASSVDSTALQATREAILTLESASDTPERNRLWSELASHHLASSQPQDALVCLAQIPNVEAALARNDVLERLLVDEADASQVGKRPTRQTPSSFEARRILVACLGRATSDNAPLPSIAEILAVETAMPIRLAWQVWRRMADQAGGDLVLLGAAHDRLLSRLFDQGLRRGVDLPAWLWTGSLARHRLERLAVGWTDIHDRLVRWLTAATGAGTPAAEDGGRTIAVAKLTLAAAAVRLENASLARTLTEEGTASLRRSSSRLHHLVADAFVYRMGQMAAGTEYHDRLPADLQDRVAALDVGPRYQFDQLVTLSWVLDPEAGRNAYLDFTDRFRDSPTTRLIEDARRHTDPSERAGAFVAIREGLESVLPAAPERTAFLRAALAEAVHLGEAYTRTIWNDLEVAWEHLDVTFQAELLRLGLRAAGQWDLETPLATGQTLLLDLLSSQRIGEAPHDLARLVRDDIRLLKRFGRTDALHDLLGHLRAMPVAASEGSVRPAGARPTAGARLGRTGGAGRDQSLAQWFLRAEVVRGLLATEQVTDALAEADRIEAALARPDLLPLHRASIATAYIQAFGAAEPEVLLDRLGRLFAWPQGLLAATSSVPTPARNAGAAPPASRSGRTAPPTPSATWDRSVLGLIDAATRAVADDDLDRQERAARFREREEAALRRLIHQDFRQRVS